MERLSSDRASVTGSDSPGSAASRLTPPPTGGTAHAPRADRLLPGTDAYFSVDVETDGPIPGPFSMLSFALVYAGTFDGQRFHGPDRHSETFYAELRPIADRFEEAALRVNGLDRDALLRDGRDPEAAMTDAADWVRRVAGDADPVFVGYPLGFDWSWLYWYFVRFSRSGSPFGHSKCFDIKTAVAVRLSLPIGKVGRHRLPPDLQASSSHTHHALDDAIEQAEIFAKLFTTEPLHVPDLS